MSKKEISIIGVILVLVFVIATFSSAGIFDIFSSKNKGSGDQLTGLAVGGDECGGCTCNSSAPAFWIYPVSVSCSAEAPPWAYGTSECENAIDGSTNTIWHSDETSPNWPYIVGNFGSEKCVSGISISSVNPGVALRIHAHNNDTNQWDLVGIIDPAAEGWIGYNPTTKQYVFNNYTFPDVKTGHLKVTQYNYPQNSVIQEIRYLVKDCTPQPECNETECFDSDGGLDFFNKGYVNLSNGSTATDFCLSNSSLLEMYCTGNPDNFTYYTSCGSYVCLDGACVESTPITCTDNDGDSFNVSATGCGPADCNDNNATINPGMIEDCNNGVDDDCDGLIDSNDSDCYVPEPFCGDGICNNGETCGFNNSASECNIDCGVCPGSCDLVSAYWTQETATEGDIVYLNVSGNYCSPGEVYYYTIFEDDLLFDDYVDSFTSTSLIPNWTVIYQDDGLGNPEYYFRVNVSSNPSESITSSPPNLVVSEISGPSFCNGTSCILSEGDYLVTNQIYLGNPVVANIMFISSTEVKLNLSGEVTDNLAEGMGYKVGTYSDYYFVFIDDILYTSKEGGISKVQFHFQENPVCIDSDGGIISGIKGSAYNITDNLTDACFFNNTYLSEKSCHTKFGDYGINSTWIVCPTGCLDGACSPNPPNASYCTGPICVLNEGENITSYYFNFSINGRIVFISATETKLDMTPGGITNSIGEGQTYSFGTYYVTVDDIMYSNFDNATSSVRYTLSLP